MDWRDRLKEYLRGQIPSAEEIEFLNLHGMPAGASNETIGFDIRVAGDGWSHVLPVVLRPQRPNGILAPYDVGRQFRIMRALKGTDLPVPAVFWYEPTGDVLGAPFYFMTKIQGETLPLLWYGGMSPRLRAVAETMAVLHSVDWRAAGLQFLYDGAEDIEHVAPIEADLSTWDARKRRMGMDRDEGTAALERFLRRNEPADARLGLIHGDPNPGNYLCRGNEVVAVLDWELSALGDPRTDLGFYAALLTVFGGGPGHGGETILSQAYEAATGQRQTNLDYYEGVGLYKMAMITAGWGGHMGWGYGYDAISRRLAALFGPNWHRS